jgi:hypothetical protein
MGLRLGLTPVGSFPDRSRSPLYRLLRMGSMCEYTTVHYDSRPLLDLRSLACVCVEYFLCKPLLCILAEMFSEYVSRGKQFPLTVHFRHAAASEHFTDGASTGEEPNAETGSTSCLVFESEEIEPSLETELRNVPQSEDTDLDSVQSSSHYPSEAS